MAKTKTIENFFNYLAFYSHFLPVLFFFIYFRKSRGTSILWLVVIYDLYNYLTDLGLLYLNRKAIRVFLYSYFTFFEYAFFTAILYFLIKNKGFKKIIIALSICFTAFIVLYNFLANLRGIDSIPIGVETILILIFTFCYLYEQMQDTETVFIYSKYSFWIVVGMMFYLSASSFIYIYISYLPDDKTRAQYWMFTNLFSILKNIFFTIAIIVNASQPHKKQAVKKGASLLNSLNL